MACLCMAHDHNFTVNNWSLEFVFCPKPGFRAFGVWGARVLGFRVLGSRGSG